MFRKKNLKIITFALIFLIPLIIISKEISRETIIAEFEGGKITMGDIEDRISKIPPMYQSRYTSNEGKKNLLDMICTEELFFLEAVALNVEHEDGFYSRIENQIKSVYFGEYKKELFKEGISFTADEKKTYYTENPDMFKDRTYEESEVDIERRLRPEKEKHLMEDKKNELIKSYNVEIVYSVLDSFNLSNIDSNRVNAEKKYVVSSKPEMEKTIGDLIDSYEFIPQNNKIALKTNEDLKKYIENKVELDIFYYAASEKGYEENEYVKEIVEQIKRNMMLRTTYNKLVVETIGYSDENIEAYYHENIDQFSSKAYRKIQVFGFDSQATAKKKRKLVKKYIKKNDEEAISKLIEENSVYTAKNGELDHIYKNGIVPGIGKDEVYSNMIWEAEFGKLSKVFKNSKDVFVFFRLLEDHEAKATPFVEIKDRIKSQMQKNLSKEKFEAVSAELETKYNLKKFPERMIVKLTAEEYFNKAEEAQKKKRFNDAIYYYDEIIKYHVNNSDDYKAFFMKGFLYAEELKDKEKAMEIFNELIDKFPEGDLHESARFMISELEGKSDMIENFESSDQ